MDDEAASFVFDHGFGPYWVNFGVSSLPGFPGLRVVASGGTGVPFPIFAKASRSRSNDPGTQERRTVISKTKSRVGTLMALVGALVAALTLGMASPASASSVPAFELRICSQGSFTTNAYYDGGGFMSVPAGQCKSHYWQGWGPNPVYVIHVDTYVANGGYIAGANVDIAKGAGLATGGTAKNPYLWSF